MSKHMLFVFAAIALAGGGIFARASSTRTARAEADKIARTDTAGSDTAAELAVLKDFVKSHMGASVSFTLQPSYDRAAAAAAAAATSTPNSQIYADAQKACAGKSDSIVQARCNAQYLAQHLSNVPAPAPVPAPVLANYQYKLVAPFWTPDLAGALLLGALVALGLAVPIGRTKARRS